VTNAVRSMTGSGAFVVETEVGRVEVEARSVNHRFLKSSARGFGPLPQLDARVDACVKRFTKRGHVSVHVRFQPAASGGASRIDEQALADTAKHLKRLAFENELPAPTVSDVLATPGVLSDVRAELDTEKDEHAVDAGLEGALAALVSAREREGALMKAELDRLLEAVTQHVTQIEQRAGEVPAGAQERLKARLDELLEGSGAAVDPAQLARECALLADRADVREEIARLQAHVQHAGELLAKGGPVGRRLDFLVQEMHRETNTIGSKANDLALTRFVMDLKSDVERMREQVQNLE